MRVSGQLADRSCAAAEVWTIPRSDRCAGGVLVADARRAASPPRPTNRAAKPILLQCVDRTKLLRSGSRCSGCGRPGEAQPGQWRRRPRCPWLPRFRARHAGRIRPQPPLRPACPGTPPTRWPWHLGPRHGDRARRRRPVGAAAMADRAAAPATRAERVRRALCWAPDSTSGGWPTHRRQLLDRTVTTKDRRGRRGGM
jgi:hypothetical protein